MQSRHDTPTLQRSYKKHSLTYLSHKHGYCHQSSYESHSHALHHKRFRHETTLASKNNKSHHSQ